MRYKGENNKRNMPTGIIPLVMAILLLAFVLPTTLDAEQYYVWGRVFCASPIEEGAEVPPNPLDVITNPDQIVGDNLVAEIPRNLAMVRVIRASNRSELGCFTTTSHGNYFIGFNAPGPNIETRLIVEDLLSGEVLMESEPNILNPWTVPADENNVRHLLFDGSLIDISDGRDFYPTAVGTHTGIFTRIGKIELETKITNPTPPPATVTHRLIDTSTGRVTVPEEVGAYLAISRYKDAPLGGNLYMFGAFDQALYLLTSVHYRIRIENLDTSTVTYLSDPLIKTLYTVDLSAIPPTVTADRTSLGPFTVGTDENCYKLTPLSTSSGSIHEFWSFPDKLALWRTSEMGLNGTYLVTIEVVGLGGGWVPVPDFTSLKVFLDNEAPTAKILPIGAGDESHPTPRVYIPPSAAETPSGCDLTNTRMGTWSSDYGGTANPICSILDLSGAVGDKYLAFKLSAHHDNGDGRGYLLYWRFRYRRNDEGYQTHIGKYFGSVTSMNDYGTVQFTSTETDAKGFLNKYLYLDKRYLEAGVGTTKGGCGYRFIIEAHTRTTDGYHYIRYALDEDIHYVIR